MDTKENIMTETFHLIMKYGIKSVSMDDISSRIGISKKTIYQYFENKKMLISEVISDFVIKDEMEIRNIVLSSSNAIDEIVNVARHSLLFLRSMSPSMIYDTKKYYPQVWKKVEKDHFEFIHEVIKKNIERGQHEGLYHTDSASEIIARLYIQQSLTLTNEDIFPLSRYDRGELFKNMITYHIRGLMSDKGRKVAEKLELE